MPPTNNSIITKSSRRSAKAAWALFDLRNLRAVVTNEGYTATSDRQRFLFVTSAEDAYLTPFTVVTNWMAEMKK